MLKLIIKHKGKIFQQVDLPEISSTESSSDLPVYVIGRGKKSDIVLPEHPSISRKHLQFSLGEDHQWVVKNLSQTGRLIVEGEETEEATVPIDGSFQTGDFEFILKEEKQELAHAEEESSDLSAFLDPQAEQKEDKKETSELSAEGGLPVVSSPTDQTRIINTDGESSISAYLKVSYGDSVVDIFKLEEGTEWTVGRDVSADITLEDPNISRKHFKIRKENEQYYIKDLNSANGTVLQDKELKPAKSYLIQSGDVVLILDIEITFEIKNLSLAKELSMLKAPLPLPVKPSASNLPPSSYTHQQVPFPTHIPGVIVENQDGKAPLVSKKNKKKWIRYGVGMVVILALAGLLSGNENKEKKSNNKQVANLEEKTGLPAKKAQFIKDTYLVVQQLYTTEKYEYCKSEVQKIHALVDSYKQSKTLEIACTQAAENQKKQYHLEQRRAKAKQTEERIKKITQKCDNKFNTFKEKHHLVSCLNPAIELNPADSRIHALTDRFEAIELEKKEAQKRRTKRKKFISSIMKKYHYARSLKKSGKPLKTIAAYQDFIKASNHPELQKTRKEAQRELASFQKNFHDNNNKMNRACQSYFNSKNFKTAYYTCKKASQNIPNPHNKIALELMDQSKQSLETQMKPLYESAGLNESVGNISIAMEYWKKIINQDIKTGLYYQRAKEKVKKY